MRKDSFLYATWLRIKLYTFFFPSVCAQWVFSLHAVNCVRVCTSKDPLISSLGLCVFFFLPICLHYSQFAHIYDGNRMGNGIFYANFLIFFFCVDPRYQENSLLRRVHIYTIKYNVCNREWCKLISFNLLFQDLFFFWSWWYYFHIYGSDFQRKNQTRKNNTLTVRRTRKTTMWYR